MDVRAKQRLSYQRVFLPFACVYLVSLQGISTVICYLVKPSQKMMLSKNDPFLRQNIKLEGYNEGRNYADIFAHFDFDIVNFTKS